MVMPSFYKKPRMSLGTRVEASLGKRSAKSVYKGRKVEPLTGFEKNILVNRERLVVQGRGGGWARVTYRNANDPRGGVTFNIRLSKIKDVMNKPPSIMFHPAEAVYSEWIHTSEAGKYYTNRRQVEGMLKTAIKKGDMEMAEQLRKILAKDDKTVYEFRQAWLNAHEPFEIADFYDYEEEETW